MMAWTDWTGLSGIALGLMVLLTQFSPVSRWMKQSPLAFVVAAYVLLMMPVAGLSLAGFVRGLVGDLSITSILLLGAAMASRVNPSLVWDVKERQTVLLLVMLVALGLYPLALGWGGIDPYRYGFDSALFIGVLALMTGVALYRRLILLPLIFVLAVLAWRSGWYESTNLWDYLLDVPLVFYALGATLKRWFLNRGKRV